MASPVFHPSWKNAWLELPMAPGTCTVDRPTWAGLAYAFTIENDDIVTTTHAAAAMGR